jgi:hypothetical protein
MTDRTQEITEPLRELNGIVQAAQQAYDSTVTLSNGDRKLASLKAVGPVQVDWSAAKSDTLTTLITNKQTFFQIDTPLGRVPGGPRHHLYFYDEAGKLLEQSKAAGPIFDGVGNKFGSRGVAVDRNNLILWTDDKGVFHKRSLNNQQWVVSDSPLK